MVRFEANAMAELSADHGTGSYPARRIYRTLPCWAFHGRNSSSRRQDASRVLTRVRYRFRAGLEAPIVGPETSEPFCQTRTCGGTGRWLAWGSSECHVDVGGRFVMGWHSRQVRVLLGCFRMHRLVTRRLGPSLSLSLSTHPSLTPGGGPAHFVWYVAMLCRLHAPTALTAAPVLSPLSLSLSNSRVSDACA